MYPVLSNHAGLSVGFLEFRSCLQPSECEVRGPLHSHPRWKQLEHQLPLCQRKSFMLPVNCAGCSFNKTKQKKTHTLSSLTSRDSAVDASWIFSAGELPLSRAEPQSEGRRLRLQQRSEPRPSRSLVRQPLLIPDPDPLLGFPCLSSVRRRGLRRPAEERAAWRRHRDGGGASRRRPAARSPRSRLLQPFQGADCRQILIRRSRFNTT